MSSLRSYLPFSLLSCLAAVIALAIAWEPGEAEAGKPSPEAPVLRASIIETGFATAPDCPQAVWPHVGKDCLLHPDIQTAERAVRTIVIDDRTFNEKRATLRRLAIGL